MRENKNMSEKTQKRLKFIALFMIFLVVGIPIYSAQAYATLTTYSLNKNNVRNYRAVDDRTTIVAEADGNLKTTDLILTLKSQTAFSSCVFNNDRTACSKESAIGPWLPGKYDYSVRMAAGGASVSNSIYVDNSSPKITVFNVNSGKQISASYTISERAYLVSDSSKCSGIKTINFKLGAETLESLNVNFTPGTNCNYQNEILLDAPSTDNQEKNFCIEVFDNVGNKGERCEKVLVDREAGLASDAVVVNAQNQPIKFVSAKTGPISAIIKFNLEEHKLTRVNADASEFTVYDAQKQVMNNLEAVCSPASCDGSCTCEVPITLNLPQGGIPNLRLNIYDSSDNSAELVLPVAIEADNEAPRLIALSAKECGAKDAIGPTNNTVYAIIEDSGSGMAGKKAYLDLSSVLGAGFSRLYPNECTLAGIQWLCRWGPFRVTSSPSAAEIPMQVTGDSQDDAGNFMSVIENKFYYDNKNPVISGHSIIAASNLAFGSEITQYPVSGGTIELNIRVSDDLPVSASADFSNIAPVGKRTATCSGNADQQTCTFSFIGPLYNGPLSNLAIPVTVTDCVGNKNSTVAYINISAVETRENNYWSYSVGTGIPAKLDRETLSVFSLRAFYPVSAAGSPSVNIISQQIIDCTPSGNADYLSFNSKGARLPEFRNSPSVNPSMKVTVQAGVNPPDALPFTCVVKTISRTQRGAISFPELDNVSFTVNFYDSPLDTYDEATKDKIAEVKNSPLVQGQILGQLDTIRAFLQKLCGVWSVLSTTVSGLDALQGVLAWMQGTPAAPAYLAFRGAVLSIHTITDDVGSVGANIIGPACSFLGCDNVLVKSVKEFLDFYTGAAFVGRETNIQDSLLYSTVSLCIPGIIINLQKARLIECSYVDCMQNQISQGVSPYYCDYLRGFSWCTFVMGELFNLIPLSDLAAAVDELIKNLPQALLSYAADAIFAGACKACKGIPEGLGQSVCFSSFCSGPKLAKAITDLIANEKWQSSLKALEKTGDYCEDLLKE